MSGSLFGSNNTVPGSSGGNRHLLEFRCGKMSLMGKMVHPDARKGLAYMYQSDDGLVHFCWKERTASGKIEDDLIIFPDDCEFKRVGQCKTGRVFLLKFKSSSRKLFYWMQEPKTDKDDDNCRRVNDIMNTPNLPSTLSQVARSAAGGGSGGGGGGGGGSGGSDNSDLQSLLSNMSQQQLMHLFNGVTPMGIASFLGSMRPNNFHNRMNSSGGTGSSARTSSATAAAAASNSTTTTTTTTATTTSSSSSATSTTTNTTPVSTTGTATTTAASTTTTTTTTPVTPSNAASTNVSTPTAPRRSSRLNREDSSGSAGSVGSSSGGGGGGTEQTSSNSKPAQKISLTELQSFLSGIKGPPTTDSVNLNGPNIDLSSAINTETMNSLFKNCDGDRIRSLASHLPILPTTAATGGGGGGGGTTTESGASSGGGVGGKIENVDEAKKEIKDTILSPQFQQALSMFSSALQSGQLGPVVSQFSLSSEAIAAANAGDLEDFVKAMEKSTTASQSTSSSTATKSNEKGTGGGTDDKKSSSSSSSSSAKDKGTDKSE